MSLTVATVLRSGGWYDEGWVERLYGGVSRNLPDDLAWRFVCLTDLPVSIAGVSTIELREDWPGWWAKAEAWRPRLFRGRTMLLDLDTVVVRSLTWAAGFDGGIAVLRDFYSGAENAAAKGYRPDAIGSGVVLWNADRVDMSGLWKAMREDAAGIIRAHPARSDHFLEKHLPKRFGIIQELYPGKAVSYKVDCRELPSHRVEVPADASLVCFHGPPRPNRLPEDDPVRVIWESYAEERIA